MGYIERALFIVGVQNSGKTTLINNAIDSVPHWLKIGTPRPKKIKNKKYNLGGSYIISSDRKLYVRTSSFHESGRNTAYFLKSMKDKTKTGRWNVICPMQPEATYTKEGNVKMAEPAEAIKKFIERFNPEHIRVYLLDLRFDKIEKTKKRKSVVVINDKDIRKHISKLQKIKNVECTYLNVKNENKNNHTITDFFNFS
ncbi:hypothetical protein CIK05_06225 [Bdellovibrio sp. qaytius]|nr:hypothetical protein CIK05_06225 [Bdellovibrio sp. qaytius]